MFHRRRRYDSPLHQNAYLNLIFLVLMEGFIFASCRSEATTKGAVEVEVRQVGFDPLSNSPVVILQDKKGKRTMPIWIGISEAQSIALQLQGEIPPRPLTHDLVKSILEEVGVKVDKVLVNELKGSTYYARILLVNGKKNLEVDSRPSDAIALALRFHRPIFVNRALFESTVTPQERKSVVTEGNSERQLGTRLFGLTVQDLTDDLAEYFAMPASEGILVTEVEGKVETTHLQRGDVIVAVNGEKVRDISELRQKIAKRKKKEVMLLVWRNGEEINRPFSVEETIAQSKEDLQ